MKNAQDSTPPLDGLHVLVTGGGSGIGAATARVAAGQGAAVTVTDIVGSSAASVAEEIRAAGRYASSLTVDISDEEQTRRMFDQAIEAAGPVHGVVNNAGVIVTSPLEETSLEDWQRCMTVNAQGTFLGCKYAVRHFTEHGIAGAIVNTASISALTGQHGQAAYAASKGAILQLTRQVAVEQAPRGIRCNSVGPGSVHSAILDSFLNSQSDPQAAEQKLAATHPMQRIGEPEEIAAAMCFLLSPAASFITGANIQADGGYTAA